MLRAWRDSPTRFTEDTNAEHDLRVGGYRDRLFVELAQNAADAAAQAGVEGRVRVRVVDGELRVANTGAPLDAEGVASLASLRASGKRGGTVGRFGVGFAAVLAVTSCPRIVSRTGGVSFSRTRTREAAGREGEVPILRLPWPLPPTEPPLPDGFDTEVRLPLRPPAGEVLELIRSEVADLLLALPALAEVDVAGQVWTRRDDGELVELASPDGHRTRWLTHQGEACVWAVPVSETGAPSPIADDVLHAPTPTDERVSLPARLLASVPVEPSRRRVLAGEATRQALAEAAHAYPGLVRRLPPRHRLALVPPAGFPASEVDSTLRELLTRRLSQDAWLPAAAGGELAGAAAKVLVPELPDLVELLADVVPGLVAAPLCGGQAARTLASVGASTVDAAAIVDAVTGIEREPSWWRRLYEVLLDGVERHQVAADELGALPVPLTDGRTVAGPRTALLLDDVDLAAELDLAGAGPRVVHPRAAHPLLERLGAVHAGAGEVLRDPALREAVEGSVEDALAGVDVLPLVRTVLRLATRAGAEGLGALALPDRTGGWRRADELVLPGSRLLDVLDTEAIGAQAPLDVLDADFASRWPAETLTQVGVLDGFRAPAEDDDTENTGAGEDPPIADLDLVADDAWPEAVRLLASDPRTRRMLVEPGGRVRRWLADNALLAGQPPGQWRLPDAESLAGLFDPVLDVDLPDELLLAMGVRWELTVVDAQDAQWLCSRLAEEARSVPPGLVLRAHSALSRVSPEGVRPPAAVRALDGSVTDAADAVVLDAPWLLGLWPHSVLVATLDFAEAPALADVLDLPLASEETTAEVESEGDFVAWRDLPAIVEVADLLGIAPEEGGLFVHETLTVGGRPVPWWYDTALHTSDTAEGLARAFAWATGRWPRRALIAALLDDPGPATLLG
ncbi:hypothetical protein SacmaDRAFT_4754 [Saccharomonospora marina XMU15]|uniref:Uncharacterized protein n=1 Tax=Saccharomonospora marina XMU15 TaxID=882083 RepID=H5WYZ4_9PSEU|nr:hypothetical protein [Saccharomonospora marina]EHR52928.1 hypothetical protein SacmaDRAFT_4754 [Saccharomonospora marina XMU15]